MLLLIWSSCLLFNLVSDSAAIGLLGNKVFYIPRLGPCVEHPNLHMMVQGKVENGGNGAFAISGKTEIKHQIEGPLKMEARIEKCTEKANPSSCRLLMTYKVKGDLCDELKNPKSSTKEFLSMFRLDEPCPIVQRITEFTPKNFDINKYSTVLTGFGDFWTARLTFTNTNTTDLKMCIYAEVEVTESKSNKTRNYNFRKPKRIQF